jgi:hypothetical protein
MVAAVALCIALSQPYAGDLPALRAPMPKILSMAASAAGFAPPGWTVEHAVRGDLDRDGKPDLVVVLKGVDPRCIVRTENAAGTMDTNPRLLLVAFARKPGFALAGANAKVIPRIDDPYMDDPFNADALVIRNGALRLGLTFWRSMGGWTTYTSTLSFRWDGRRFALIGYDRETLKRNSGETETISVNFVTGRAKRTTGSMEDDVADSTRWKRLPAQKAPDLASIGDGLAYEPKLAPR